MVVFYYISGNPAKNRIRWFG